MSRVEEMCDELAGYGLPETIQHDDFHDGQVFVRDGRYLLLDWGDACVSHPFFTLSVTLEGQLAWGLDDVHGSVDVRPFRDAYLRAFAPLPTTPTSTQPARSPCDSAGSAGPSTATSAGRKPPRRTNACACSSTAGHDAGVQRQLQGYGLFETGWRSPVAKRSKRNGCSRSERSPRMIFATSLPTPIIL